MSSPGAKFGEPQREFPSVCPADSPITVLRANAEAKKFAGDDKDRRKGGERAVGQILPHSVAIASVN
jgi:hypothetical protein